MVFQIYGKITGLWNIGHNGLHLFLGQSLHNTDTLSQSMRGIHETLLKFKIWTNSLDHEI